MGLLLALVTLLTGPAWPVSDPVELPVMYENPYRLRTQITKSVRRDTEPVVSETHSWEVSVTPTDEGFQTIWRDLDKRQILSMEIDTDESLVPIRISNLPDIRRQMAETLLEDDKDETGARVMGFFDSMPEATLTALLTQDAAMISMGQGRRLTAGEPYRYSEEVQPFNGGPMIASEGAVELQEIDAAAGRAVVTWSYQLDEKAMSAAMPALIRALASPLGLDPTDQAKMEEAVDGALVSKTRHCRYDIEMATGLASSVQCVSNQEIVIMGERSKTETRLEATQTLLP